MKCHEEMKHRNAAQKCSTEMQHRNAAQKCSTEMQLRNAAQTVVSYAPYVAEWQIVTHSYNDVCNLIDVLVISLC